MSTVKPGVVVVSTSTQSHGGIATVVSHYLSPILCQQFDVVFLATHITGSKLAKLSHLLWAFLRLPRFLFSSRFKLFHVHSASRASFFRKSLFVLLAKLFRKKVILHWHGGEFMTFYQKEVGRYRQAYIRKIFSLADHVVVLSSQWERNISQLFPMVPVSVVHNPVEDCDSASTEKSKPLLLFLGDVVERKGVWDIFKALAVVLEQNSDWEFKFAGNGKVEAALEFAHKTGLSNHVEYLGWVSGDQKRQLLCDADLFLLPSYNECMPMSVLEGMAASTAIIATPVGGIPDMVQPSQNGELVPVGDVTALASAIQGLLENQSQMQEYGKQSKAIVTEKFSVNVVLPQVATLYKQVIEGQR